MATKNLVPRATGEGSLGTAAKKWGNIYADNITLQDGETLATKISSQNSRITTAEGTVTTLSGDVTSLYSSVDELSSGKADKSTTYTKTEVDTSLSGKVNKSGDTITGLLSFDTGNAIRRNVNTSFIDIGGGSDNLNGGQLTLFGKDYTGGIAGAFILSATDGSEKNSLIGKFDGSLLWCDNSIEAIVASGTNYIRYASGLQICWGAIEMSGATGTVKWTYPLEFPLTRPMLFTGNWWSNTTILGFNTSGISDARISINVYWSNGGTNARDIELLAIGRWK